nr:hypothetical protein [Treponema sp.]
MKKAFFAIFILILSSSLHVFSEVEIDGGLGFSHEKEKLKTEEFTFEASKFNVELMGQLRYYLSKDSKFGFGFSCSIPFSSDNADFDYTGTDSYHIIHDEPYWIQDNSAPVKYFYDVSAFNFSISPDLFYRLNFTESSKMFIAFGPTYGIESRKYLYADEKDAVTRDTGVSKYSGYKVINIEKVKRQHLGLEAQLSYSFGTKFVKTFGIKTAYSFFEKSKF